MYSESGLTFGDLKQKINEVNLPDDTDLYITITGCDYNYTVHSIGVVGIKQEITDDEDRPDGCPEGFELITKDVIEPGDVIGLMKNLGEDDVCDFIIDYMKDSSYVFEHVKEAIL